MALLAAALAQGCSSPTTGLVLSYIILSGADQTGEAGTALGPVVVRVTDAGGRPQAGTLLRANPRGGGSVTPIEATSASNGELTFTWTLGAAAGGQELLIQDVERGAEFSVYAVARTASVASVTVSPTTANLAAGQTQQFTATVRDARGDVLTGRVITWNSSNTNVASVGGFTGIVGGVGGGIATITASSEGRSGTASVTVASGPPIQLVVVTQPGQATDGSLFGTQPVVELRDAAGGLAVSGPDMPVTVAVQSGPGVLSGTMTVQSSNGTARFTNLRITGVGLYTLVFTAPGLAQVTTSSFGVSDASSGAVTVTTSGLPVAIQGSPYSVALGATGGTGSYVWSLAAGTLPAGISLSDAGVLSGTPTAVGTSNFSVRATSGALSGERGLNLTVQLAGGPVATHLTIGTQPGGAVSASNFTTQPAVSIRDAQGAIVAGSSVAVTAIIASGTGTLSGAVTVFAVNGTATFTNLRITGTGTHTLAFSSPGLTGVTSASFNVTAGGGGGPTAGLNVGAATPESVQAGQNISIPIILDMSVSAGANVGAIQFGVSWDPTKFDFVSGAVNGASGFTLTPNTSNSGAGSISVAGFAVTGVTTTTTLYTIVLTARVAASGTSGTVSATVTAAADQNGAPVTVTPRNLTVNITP